MPVIRSAVRSVLSDTIREAVVSPWRYFSTFDPVLNSYGELDTEFTPSGDFEYEVDVSTVDTVTALQCVMSGTANGNNEIACFVQSDGNVRAFAYVGTTLQTAIVSSGLSVNDGQLHTIELTYTGTTAELFVDGASEGSATWALDGNQDIKFAGSRTGSTQYFNGIIANVKLTDLATSSNSRIFPVGLSGGASVENSTINSGSITYYNLPTANQERFTFDEPNQRWIGEELWDNDTAVASGDWTYAGDGVFDINGSAGTLLKMPDNFDFVTESIFTWAKTSGEIRLGNVGFFVTSGSGDYAITGIDSSSYGFKRSSGTVIGSLSSISVKRALELA